MRRMNVIPAFHKWYEGELFIHLHTYLLSVDYIPGTALVTDDIVLNKAIKFLLL